MPVLKRVLLIASVALLLLVLSGTVSSHAAPVKSKTHTQHLWLAAYYQVSVGGQYACQFAGWYHGTYITRWQYPYGGCPPYMLYHS